jgi:hypothetical protein
MATASLPGGLAVGDLGWNHHGALTSGARFRQPKKWRTRGAWPRQKPRETQN